MLWLLCMDGYDPMVLRLTAAVDFLRGSRHRRAMWNDLPSLSAQSTILLLASLTVGACPGDVPRASKPQLTLAAESLASRLATGARHTCLLNASGNVLCWGENVQGQLGTPQAGNRSKCKGEDYLEEVEFPGRCANAPTMIEDLNDVTSLAAGSEHTCALKKDGTVWCWGSNWFGALGIGRDGPETCENRACARTPQKVAGIQALALAAGGENTCVIRADGGVSCWGQAGLGVLGEQPTDGLEKCTVTNEACSRKPLALKTLGNVVALAVGGMNACALASDGRVLCWGHATYGAVGVDPSSGVACAAHDALVCQYSPQVVRLADTSEVRATAIAMGFERTCALNPTGEVLCWGRNDGGQLGAPLDDTLCGKDFLEVGCRWTPAPVWNLSRALKLFSGASCAEVQGGELLCWGPAESGQLGVRNAPARCQINGTERLPCARSAVRVELPARISDLASSASHACALDDSNRLFCWGSNSSGQIGEMADQELCTIIQPDQREPCVRLPYAVQAGKGEK